MQKRTVSKVGLWVAIVVGVFVLGLMFFGRFELRFSEADLQGRVNAELAKRTDVDGFIMIGRDRVKVEEVALSVGEKDMGVAFKMEGVRLFQNYRLAASAVGVPEFREGAFYFKASNVEIGEFLLGDGKLADHIKAFAEKWVDGDRKRNAIIKAAPKIAEWAKTYAERGAVATLQKLPVYKVKNDVKGILLKASLESLKIDRGYLVATVSVLQITWHMLIIAFACFMAMGLLIAMARNPGWGVTALVASSIIS